MQLDDIAGSWTGVLVEADAKRIEAAETLYTTLYSGSGAKCAGVYLVSTEWRTGNVT